jgi:glycosyltransferase involved in cell wall biosynthesis
LLRDVRPDVAHCHNIYHQISPSIFYALRDYNVPVVMTAHDAKLVCGNYTLSSHGAPCERCRFGAHYHAVVQRCVKGALLPSVLTAAEMYLHRFLGVYQLVDTIITPSAYLRGRLLDGGFPAEKVIHIPNFVDGAAYKAAYAPSNRLIYFGRLAEEKGVATLIEAMRLVPKGELLIAGEGRKRTELEALSRRYRLRTVRFLGHLSGKALIKAIGGAAFAVLPSQCHENNPMAILEAFALGKPVVASEVGGIPELIEHGRHGFLFQPGNAYELANHINYLLANTERTWEMGKAARRRVEMQFDPGRHCKRVLNVYESLLGRGASPIPRRAGDVARDVRGAPGPRVTAAPAAGR